MPKIVVDDGYKINIEVEGPESAPALMLSNSLGTNLHMWDAQVPELSRKYRVIRYDRRGHGQSDVPASAAIRLRRRTNRFARRCRADRGARRCPTSCLPGLS